MKGKDIEYEMVVKEAYFRVYALWNTPHSYKPISETKVDLERKVDKDVMYFLEEKY